MYAIANERDDSYWNGILTPVASHLQRCRILRSHSCHGEVTVQEAEDGTVRAVGWGGSVDLLFFNPAEYLRTHPHIEEVWWETINDDTYSASTGGSANDVGRVGTVHSSSVHGNDSTATSEGASVASSSVPIQAALVIRRREFSYNLAVEIRAMQHDAFDQYGFLPPAARYFLSTLHGR